VTVFIRKKGEKGVKIRAKEKNYNKENEKKTGKYKRR